MPFLSDRKDVKNFVSYTYNWKLQEALILRKIYAVLERKHYLNYYLWKPINCRKDLGILGNYLDSNLYSMEELGNCPKITGVKSF